MTSKSSTPKRFSAAERAVGLVVVLSLLGFVLLLGMVHQGFEALSGVRAYVAGEGLWSKAQKDAVYHLLRYALLEEEEGYDRFLEELEVTLGDRQARLELERPEPDMERVREGFLRGGNHPDDVDRMATFFRRYRNVSQVHRAIDIWAQGDDAIDELLELGAEIRQGREADRTDEELEEFLAGLDALTAHLTDLAERFSAELGQGGREAQRVLFLLILSTALLIALLASSLAWRLVRRLGRADASLRASEARNRALFENSPFGVYRSTLDGRLLEVNPALVRMLGYPSAEELLGVDMAEELYADPDTRTALVKRSLTEGRVFRNVQVEWRRQDGSVLLVSLTGRVLPNEEGTPEGYEMFVEDVTEARMLANQLREAQKMEALGQLTGGIAHDFNNLLTVIIASAALLRDELQDRQLESEFPELGEVEQAASRGAEMVSKLLAFSRRTNLELEDVDLPRLIEETHGMLRRVLPTSIEIQLHLDVESPPVRADPGAIEQMLLNLATNARDAMPHGGELQIVVEPWDLEGRGEEASGPGAPRSGSVALRVRDTGDGMPMDLLERVFEPFFTTKPPGAGTGLGLPMVYGLARQQGGMVEIESEAGEGTEVRILLARSDPDDDAPAGMTTETSGATGNGARIALLFHRDRAVRDSIQRLLENEGFEVVPVSTLTRLRERLAEDPDRVALVVKQSRGTTGEHGEHTALLDAIRTTRPHVPFLVVGGYSAQDVATAGGEEAHGISVLHDPWEAEDLIRRLRGLLNWSRRAGGGERGAAFRS